MKRVITAVVFGLLGVLAAGQALAQSNQPFRVLMIGAFSGPLGPVGKFELAGYQAAAEDINAHGGILGRHIEITAEDSAGQGTRASSILQDRLAAGQRPDAVVAGAISNETLAIIPVTTQNKIPSIAGTGTLVANNPALFPYHFQATLNYDKFSHYIANYFKERGYKKIALLTSNDANGQSTGKSEKDGMEKAGLTVVWETFGVNDLDLTAPLQRIADAKPDAMLFATLAPSSSPLVLDARTKVGLTAPTYADVNISADVAGLVQPDRLKGVYLAHTRIIFFVPPEQRTPLYNTFLEFVKKQGPMQGGLLTPAICWDNLQALALAINQAGSTDPEKIKAAMETLRVPPEGSRRFVAFKSVRFSPSDHFNIDLSDADFAVFPMGPRIDGTYKPPGN